MDNFLPEIWAMILDNLEDEKDKWSAYNVSTIWRDSLASSRSSWMFSGVFPLLFKNMSKRDLLHCRNVSKQWCLVIDQFLENNGIFRPAYWHADWWNKTIHNCDLRSKTMKRLLGSKNLIPRTKLGRRVIEDAIAQEHARCPIVGWNCYFFELTGDMNYEPLIRTCLQHFGRHIWYLCVEFEMASPMQTLQNILEILGYVPNLKKLDFNYDNWEDEAPPETLRQQLTEMLQTRLTTPDRQRLKMLETLKLQIVGCNDINEILLELFSGGALQSLSLKGTSLPSCSEFGTANLVVLSIHMFSEADLEPLMQLRAPLRKLTLIPNSRPNGTTLFAVINHFSDTLRNLKLDWGRNFYAEYPGSPEELGPLVEPFHDPDVMRACSNLKRVSLKGVAPLSFNFLCGLKANLEYLHVLMDYEREGEKDFNVATLGMLREEELDLLEKLRELRATPDDRRVIYKWNVWKYFPRLKAMTVQLWTGDHVDDRPEVEYRRDIYDWLETSGNSVTTHQ